MIPISSFRHDIAGGQGNLVISALQSPNFEHGVQGWQIAKDGSAEFNNGTFRGTVEASTFEGTDFIINENGAFFYSGTPGTGNLITAIAATAGTDPVSGQAYSAGITTYRSQQTPATSGAHMTLATGATAEVLPADLISWLQGTAPNQYAVTSLQGAQFSNQADWVAVAVTSPQNPVDGQTSAVGQLQYWDTAGTFHDFGYWAADGLTIPAGRITAVQPGTGTPASPAVSETWHSVSVPSGMTGTIRVKRLGETNFACLDIDVTITSTSTSPVSFNAGSLPSSAYYPIGQRQYDLSVNQQFTNVGNASPRVNIPTSGALGLSMPGFDTAGNTCLVSGTAIYPLD